MQETQELFADLRTTVPGGGEAIKAHSEAHVAYVARLREEGKLIMAGPFNEGGGGLLIFKANSLKEAKELSANDPFILNGIQKADLKPWSVHLS